MLSLRWTVLKGTVPCFVSCLLWCDLVGRNVLISWNIYIWMGLLIWWTLVSCWLSLFFFCSVHSWDLMSCSLGHDSIGWMTAMSADVAQKRCKEVTFILVFSRCMFSSIHFFGCRSRDVLLSRQCAPCTSLWQSGRCLMFKRFQHELQFSNSSWYLRLWILWSWYVICCGSLTPCCFQLVFVWWGGNTSDLTTVGNHITFQVPMTFPKHHMAISGSFDLWSILNEMWWGSGTIMYLLATWERCFSCIPDQLGEHLDTIVRGKSLSKRKTIHPFEYDRGRGVTCLQWGYIALMCPHCVFSGLLL